MTSRSLNVHLNIPLVLLASIISDVDLLIPSLVHRGPTHSLILIFLFFLPAFALYREKTAPYFVAVVQHSILGDHFTGGGVQSLWPLTPNWFGVEIEIVSLTNILVEWALFLTFMVVVFESRDVRILFQHHASNMLLSIPILTVLLPTLLSFPLEVPSELIVPHVIYLVLFAFSTLIDLIYMLKKVLR